MALAQRPALVEANQRLELAHGVEEMFSMLGVSSLVDLLDAYKMTASKVLSLWQKQAEQESEVEKLEYEIRELQVCGARPRQA